MIFLWRSLLWSVLDWRVFGVILWIGLGDDSRIRLRVYPWAWLRWVTIKCFDVAIGVHTRSEGSPNISSRFGSRLDLWINLFCFLWSIAYHWILWELTAFFKLDQLSDFCIFIFLVNFIFNGFIRLRFLFRTFGLKKHVKNFINDLGSNYWCSIRLAVAILDFLSVVCSLGRKSGGWSLRNVSASIVEREFLLIFIYNCFNALTAAIRAFFCFIVFSFLFLDHNALNFNRIYLFFGLSELFNRSDIFNTSENGRERLLSLPICCLVGRCPLWNRSLIYAIISSEATARMLVRLQSFCTSKCLWRYFTAVFVSIFWWSHISLHFRLWCHSIVIGNISSSGA